MTIARTLTRRCLLLAGGVLLCAVLTTGCERPPSGGVRIAAASDLRYALDEVIAEYRKARPGVSISVTYGSSGNFHAQLSNKAPYDMFFSADITYPRQLIEAGHAPADSEFAYAIGRLAVWVPHGSSFDGADAPIPRLAAQTTGKIAIANPQHAPYGRAAEAALRHYGIYDRVAERLVLGDNVAQAAQFAESGAADAGIIALSLAVAPALRERGRHWPVPAEAHPPLLQGGVTLNWAQDAAAAREFRAFVMGPRGKAILRQYGFAMPGE